MTSIDEDSESQFPSCTLFLTHENSKEQCHDSHDPFWKPFEIPEVDYTSPAGRICGRMQR
jgi:hypothetical protein